MQTISTSCLMLLTSTCVWHQAESFLNFGIYGGKPVPITEVPFMALFRPKATPWHCGASIINRQFLISAGHCVIDIPLRMRVTVGADTVDGGKDYEIEKIIRHPKYFNNGTIVDYDLSIIKLKRPLDFNDNVMAIEIANSTLPEPGEMLQSLGFGRTENNNSNSKILLKVDVPYVDNETCIKHNGPYVTNHTICAGGRGSKSTCNGDSGGPLIFKGRLIGVVSRRYTDKCAAKGHPDGYAYIPSMIEFVQDIIKKSS